MPTLMRTNEAIATTSTTGAHAAPRRRVAVARGFSLLELMLVLVILGLLAGVAAVAIPQTAQRAKVRVTKASMNVIKSQITQYQLAKSRLPETLFDLIPGYLEEGKTTDGWGSEIYYKPTPGQQREYQLISAGKDLEFNTDDDIDVWTMDFTEDEG